MSTLTCKGCGVRFEIKGQKAEPYTCNRCALKVEEAMKLYEGGIT